MFREYWVEFFQAKELCFILIPLHYSHVTLVASAVLAKGSNCWQLDDFCFGVA